ncbi:MAG: TRAP transporter small permease subunit [Burkholderiaceae bacterium]
MFRLLESLGLWASALAVVVLGSLVIVSIAGRVLIGRIVPDDNILVGDLMVAIVALSWAVVIATRGNIAVEVFTNWVGPRARHLLDAFGSLIGLAMVLPLTWASWLMLGNALTRGTYHDGLLHVPQWPGRLLFFYAFLMMSCRLVLLIVDDLFGFASKRADDSTAR